MLYIRYDDGVEARYCCRSLYIKQSSIEFRGSCSKWYTHPFSPYVSNDTYCLADASMYPMYDRIRDSHGKITGEGWHLLKDTYGGAGWCWGIRTWTRASKWTHISKSVIYQSSFNYSRVQSSHFGQRVIVIQISFCRPNLFLGLVVLVCRKCIILRVALRQSEQHSPNSICMYI